MFTSTFWRATVERAISTAAQAAILTFGADQLNAINANWVDVLGFAAGGFVLAVLKALAVQQIQGQGPGVGNAEVLHTDVR